VTAGTSRREAARDTARVFESRQSLNLKWFVLAIAILMTARGARAQGFVLGGFFDMQASTRGGADEGLSFGDVELDLERDLAKKVQLSAAVVMNGDGADLAVAFVDVHFFGGRMASPGPLPVEKSLHLQAGRFDVPFGQDWQYFASKDRPELSAPFTTEQIMEGGSSGIGVWVFGSTQELDYSAFALRLESGVDVRGGRVGFAPSVQPFKAGFSILEERGRRRTRFLAIDSEAEFGRCRVRAELVRKESLGSDSAISGGTQSGWHLTAAYAAGTIAGIPLMPYARYDTAARVSRFTAGMNVNVSRFLVLKFERQRALSGSGPHAWLAQAVVVF